MPIKIPHRDPENSTELIDVTYWSAAELAEKLGYHPNTVRRRAQHRQWPHLRLPGRGDRHVYWFNAEHIERIREIQTVDIDEIPAGPIRLVEIADPRDTEGIG